MSAPPRPCEHCEAEICGYPCKCRDYIEHLEAELRLCHDAFDALRDAGIEPDPDCSLAELEREARD